MTRVMCNGTFDLLHTGHIDLINYSKSLGDYLIVAIDTDRRVKENKGFDRPVNNQRVRKTIMENLKAVDEVVFFDSDDELIEIIKSVDIRVIGSDWRGKTVVGQEHCKQLMFYERIKDESTSATIQSIIDRR